MTDEANIQNSQTPAVKKVFVDLRAHEMVRQIRRIVVEVPFDCEDEEIRQLSGCTLDYLAVEQDCDAPWEVEDGDVYDVSDRVDVETGVPENVEADLVLVRNECGKLVVEELDE
jgi:hypothetical protein